jgi:hypothetical protein
MRNAISSTTNFDMHSPMLTPPTPTSKLCITVSFATRNASLSLKRDLTYPFPLLTPQKCKVPNVIQYEKTRIFRRYQWNNKILRREIPDPGGYWWPPTYSNWLLLTVFSSTRSFVLLCNCGFYTSGVV